MKRVFPPPIPPLGAATHIPNGFRAESSNPKNTFASVSSFAYAALSLPPSLCELPNNKMSGWKRTSRLFIFQTKPDLKGHTQREKPHNTNFFVAKSARHVTGIERFPRKAFPKSSLWHKCRVDETVLVSDSWCGCCNNFHVLTWSALWLALILNFTPDETFSWQCGITKRLITAIIFSSDLFRYISHQNGGH